MIVYGVGYYFKRDVTSRQGRCTICHQAATLTSYDGTKCFSLYFIPIIPLGRKHITDECNRCRRHYVANQKKWEAARQLTTSGDLEKFRQAPSPELAASTHNGMLQFREWDRAVQFRQEAETRFPDNAQMLAAFAQSLDPLDKSVALDYYAKAHQLRPDLPAAKIGVALSLIYALSLDKAAELLAFLKEPGASQLYSLMPLERLAYAYQSINRHREALDLFNLIIERIPTASQNVAFRKCVKASQKALAKSGERNVRDILPPMTMSQRLWTFFTVTGKAQQLLILVALIVAGVLMFCFFRSAYVANNRRLYLVNGFDQPAVVTLDQQRYEVSPHLAMLLNVAEGTKTLVVSEPIKSTYTFTLKYGSTYQRIFDSDETMLNIGSAAVICLECAHYTPKDRPSIPPDLSYYCGTPLVVATNVKYPFVQMPDEINVDEHETGDHIEYGLSIVSPDDYVSALLDDNKVSDALNFLETQLVNAPTGPLLLDYAEVCAKDHARLKKFLGDHLPFAPISVPWHRDYQDSLLPEEKVALRARYDEALAHDPNNSNLLYLRSRLALDLPESKKLIDLSFQADPKNPWALYSEAYLSEMTCDWATAEKYERKAVEQSSDPIFRGVLHVIFLAESKVEEDEALLKEDLKTEPQNLELNRKLMACYFRAGSPSKVIAVADGETHYLKSAPDFPTKAQLLSSVAVSRDIYLDDFTQMEKDCDAKSDPLTYYLVLVGEKKWANVKALLIPDSISESEVLSLIISAAARADGQTELADQFLKTAITVFQAKGGEADLTIRVLKSPTPPVQADLDNLNEDYYRRAVIFTALAYMHPEMKHDYCAAARKYLVSPDICYDILDPLTAEK